VAIDPARGAGVDGARRCVRRCSRFNVHAEALRGCLTWLSDRRGDPLQRGLAAEP
jgi:hypothetical protein